MNDGAHDGAETLLALLVDELAERLAPRLAHLAESSSRSTSATPTPWLTTAEAIDYSRLPEGTFRKLMSTGKIPSHGGRAKLFYRPEIDQALLEFSGIAQDNRELRQVR